MRLSDLCEKRSELFGYTLQFDVIAPRDDETKLMLHEVYLP